MTSNSKRLRSRIALVQPALDEATAAFWGHPQLAELYPRLLIALHPVVRAAAPMMETAARAARALGDDPLSSALADYYSHHAEEERGHDEWVLSDLEVLGFTREDVLARVPPPASAALFGAQYFWVLHAHPIAFLGYIACIEGRPPLSSELDDVQARTGLPAEAFTSYRKHSQLDPQHKDDLDQLLDRLPLQEYHHNLLSISAIQTSGAVGALFNSLVRGYERRGPS